MIDPAFALAVAALAFAPLLVTRAGDRPAAISLGEGWVIATLVIHGFIGVSALVLAGLSRLSWARLLILDLLSLGALVPATMGLLLAFRGALDVVSPAWGGWLLAGVLVLRLPYSGLVRRRTAEAHA